MTISSKTMNIPPQPSGGMGMGSEGFMQMMQMQMLSMASIRNDGNMMTMIYGFIIMMLVNNLMKIIPMIISSVEKYVNKYIESKQEQYVNNVKTIINVNGEVKIKTRKGTILFEKINSEQSDDVLFALIRYISNLKNSEYVLFNNNYYVINKKEFMLEPEIYCCVLSYIKDEKTGKIEKYSFEIYSYVYNIERLKDFTDKIVNDYVKDKENKLGKQPHYFNQIYIPIIQNIDGSYRYESAYKQIMFDMIPFYTNKSLKNVFGSHLDVIKKRMDMFINNPLWYQNKGIPHTLGILLSGPPGTGKTSVIKAIACDTGRHIFNLTLNKMTTQTQLKSLFYSNEIKVLKNGNNETLYIPNDKRIYVIEDIDALGDIVLDRNIKKKLKEKNIKSTDITNLSDILNKYNISNDNNPFIKPTQSEQQLPQQSHQQPPHLQDKLSSNQYNGINDKKYNNEKYNNEKLQLNLDELRRESEMSMSMEMSKTNYDDMFGNNSDMVGYNDNNNPYNNIDSVDNLLGDDGNINDNSNYDTINNECEPSTFILRDEISKKLNNLQPLGNNLQPLGNNLHPLGNNLHRSSNRSSNSNRVDIDKDIEVYKEDKEEKEEEKEKNKNPEELTLSFLLNLLDGVLETPGRIVIMTTNHPDLLDPALIRPGRIDINLKVGNCTRDMIIKMIRYFYEDDKIEIPSSKWKYKKEISPAKLSSILQNNFDSCEMAIQELINTTN
jgi:hypothetical protein